MIKDCYVKLNNEYVTVINYDGVDVQVPAIKREARTVKVIYKDGKYTVVGDDYREPEKETPAKPTPKPNSKKTTNKRNAKGNTGNKTVKK